MTIPDHSRTKDRNGANSIMVIRNCDSVATGFVSFGELHYWCDSRSPGAPKNRYCPTFRIRIMSVIRFS